MGGSKYASESALLLTFPKCQDKKKKRERGPRRLRVFLFYPGRTDRGAFRLRAVTVSTSRSAVRGCVC